MARCGCASEACTCSVVGGTGIDVTGAGSSGNPFVISTTPSSFDVADTSTLNLTRSGTGTVLDPFIITGDVIGSVDVQTFSASGTWNRPASKVHTVVFAFGAGGGGGAGRRGATSTERAGGQGGGSGSVTIGQFRTTDLAASVAVTIGTGGTAGAAQTVNDTNGANGGDGGNTTFGTVLTAGGGKGGEGGTTANATVFRGLAGAVGTDIPGFALSGDTPAHLIWPQGGWGARQSVGGTPQSGAAAGTAGGRGSGCGGGGGGIDTSNVQTAGGLGGNTATGVASGTAGTAGGGNGGAGSSGTGLYLAPGSGGGGGGGRNTGGTGGTGGAGGTSAGGGGGGAVTNGANSGAGGVGGAGFLIVVSW